MIRTRVGYAGGSSADPTYSDMGDHTESVQIDFDPERISFEELLEVFWATHDPFVSVHHRQYRNVLFVHDEGQRELAEASLAAIAEEAGVRVATPIEAIESFTRAEDYHQKYYLRATAVVYDELIVHYDTDREFVDSTAAARLNGYLGGDGTLAQFDSESDQLGLSAEALEVVRQRVEATDASCNTE